MRLQYLWSSEPIFRKVITIVKLALSLQNWLQVIEKLNNYVYF